MSTDLGDAAVYGVCGGFFEGSFDDDLAAAQRLGVAFAGRVLFYLKI
jgi:hypothetical protein